MFKIVIVVFVLFGNVNLSDVSFYEILGITKHSTTQEIRQAYKKLAIKYHPDKNQDDSVQEKFLKITEAYETLKDPQKRRMYDTFGVHQPNSRQHDYRSQKEYNTMFYNGLYHEDPFVDTVSGKEFYNYLSDGFHFINFYSPFCPPCQNLAEHWKKLAEVYKGIVKVGAVNCKYHNSFCYNSMRIGSYPSLLFYPDGKKGNYIYYRGAHTFKALEDFVLSYIEKTNYVPTLTYLRGLDKPMVYVLGRNRIDHDALTRLAYHLNGLVTLAVIEDDNLRSELTNNEYTTVVYRYRKTVKEITSTEEKEILGEIIESLPTIEPVDPEKFKDIRNQLRNGYQNAWVLYFSKKDDDKLLLYQMRMKFPVLHFGEIDCDAWSHLCLSLQVDATPAWALLKPGGAYQKASPSADLKTFLRVAPLATQLHSLAPSAIQTLHEDVGTWVVLVVPYKASWDTVAEAFTRASLHFRDSKDISFGIITCSEKSAHYCREVSSNSPLILIQTGDKRDLYSGRVDEHQVVDFIQLIKDSADMELTQEQALEILDPSREETWLVAYLPPGYEDLKHVWRLVANKLRPLDFVRVGVLVCARGAGGFCANVRAPTARLYPIASGQHYSVSLQHLNEAPYILEWALEHIDDSVQKLNWNSFSKRVIAEELQPTSGKKPWLVYFHSPRCYRCYEMYADFAIAGILLNNAVNLGRVNCLNERGVCQHEHITSYPSLRLYLNRNTHQRFSSVTSIHVQDYASLLKHIKAHLMTYDETLLAGIDMKSRHDEL
ncbi:dnaJ homolog subfamily C member 10-like [Leguminivora glycinivorella]|uniref:dnaJ homolog subfamily C member 10-like n=1 Tax=Leguminivora glycinivorella TaxID=1035111 RepID=UPI00200D767B|nr:dnaJ homolog subfamily C member 10-like [Leguminivora glycinivorella]